MSNDPKNNSKPTVFISSFFREQLWVFPAVVAFFGIMVRTCMDGLILLFTITVFCGAVVWYSFKLKENGTDPHSITVNSPLVCGPLSDARPITTNATCRHLQVPPCIPLRFHDKAICIEKIVTKAASCTPSCGSSVRRWVASRTKQASALDVALFHQVQIRSIA